MGITNRPGFGVRALPEFTAKFLFFFRFLYFIFGKYLSMREILA